MKRSGWARRLVCLCLCGLLTGGMIPRARAAGTFTDVPADHWAAGAIARCVTQGWFQGKSADVFGMGQPMTRGAFAVVLSRLFGWESGDAYYQIFSDVPQGAWYEPALRACYEHGAVTRQTGDFRPGDPITREELAVMLIRALGYGPIAGLAEADGLPFTDVSTNQGNIAMAYELGLVSGMSQTLFVPDRAATREQVAVMLTRLYDKLHPVNAQENAAILAADEELPDLTGCDTLILTGSRLAGGRSPKLTGTLSADQEAAAETMHERGGTVLLGVSVSANVTADGAAVLAQAASDGGYDGIYLTMTQTGKDAATRLTDLSKALRTALPEGKLYVAVSAPVRGKTAPDYTALGQAADRLVVQVAAYQDDDTALPVAAMEPLEAVYYAFSVLNDQVSGEKLLLSLTAEGTACTDAGKTTALDGAAVEEAAEKGTVYYSDRYACAYLRQSSATVWYLNEESLAARRQLLGFFGSGVCFSTLHGTVMPAN